MLYFQVRGDTSSLVAKTADSKTWRRAAPVQAARIRAPRPEDLPRWVERGSRLPLQVDTAKRDLTILAIFCEEAMNALMSRRLLSHLFAISMLFCLLGASPRTLCADAIHSAASKGDLKRIAELVATDPSVVSSKDKNGKTPLHLAVEEDHKDVAEFLINHGADVNARDESGSAPLDLALSSYHYMDVAQLLVDKDANVNAATNNGTTPLMQAALRGQKDAVTLLLSKEAAVNARDSKGDSPLLWSLLFGHANIAEMLINAGADVNAANVQGLTPLFMAQKRGFGKIVEMLRQHGALR